MKTSIAFLACTVLVTPALTLQRGIIGSVRITPLPGDGWVPGPSMDDT
jgi:hypothetical protein